MNKKIFIVLTAALAMIATFTSCHRDGVYRPWKKIGKIYRNEYLHQIWTWENNRLERIDYIEDEEIIRSEFYRYDEKNRIKRIECSRDEIDGDEVYLDFKYKGNRLSRISFYIDEDFHYEYIYHYDGKKISSIDISLDGVFASTTYKMEWEGGNIEKIAVYSDRSQPDMTIRYTYDTKVNPFKDFYCIGLFSDGDIPVNAYNNIERAVFDYYDGSNHRHDVVLRSYEYDGLFPTMIRTQSKYGDDVVYIEYE